MRTIAEKLEIQDFPFHIYANGHLVYQEKEDHSWVKFRYNPDGFITHVESSNGFLWDLEAFCVRENITGTIAQQLNIQNFPFEILVYRGNVIYRENSDGYWWKREYDSMGNQTYYENSDGYWYKCEFDSMGNMTYSRDSYGNTYGHPSKIVIDGITYEKAE